MPGDTNLQGGWMGDWGQGGAANEAPPSPGAVEGASPPLAEPVLCCVAVMQKA